MEFSLKTNEESFNLEAAVRLIGQDLLVSVWGGEKPHIGAVSIAQPRPSLSNKDQTSASTSVYCFLNHKEDELAKTIATELARSLNRNVVVTAGIHWDDITSQGVSKVIKNSALLTKLIIDRIESGFNHKKE